MNSDQPTPEKKTPAAEAWAAWDAATADPRFRVVAAVDYDHETRLYQSAPGGRIERVVNAGYCTLEATRQEIQNLDRLMSTGHPRFRLLRQKARDTTAPWLRFYPPLRPGESIKSADPCIGGLGHISAI